MGFPAFGLFLGFTNNDVIAVSAWNCAFDQQQIVGLTDLDDFKVLRCAPDLAHVAGHFHAAHDGAGKQALANGSGTPMPAFRTVSGITAGEMMALDDALKAAPLGDANGIDIIAGSKKRRANLLARFHFFGEITKFLDAFHGDAVEFFDMAKQRLGETVLFLIIKPELNGVVAVGLLGLALKHAVGAGEHNGDRSDNALSVVNAGLAQLFS